MQGRHFTSGSAGSLNYALECIGLRGTAWSIHLVPRLALEMLVY